MKKIDLNRLDIQFVLFNGKNKVKKDISKDNQWGKLTLMTHQIIQKFDYQLKRKFYETFSFPIEVFGEVGRIDILEMSLYQELDKVGKSLTSGKPRPLEVSIFNGKIQGVKQDFISPKTNEVIKITTTKIIVDLNKNGLLAFNVNYETDKIEIKEKN